MELEKILQEAAARGASDVFLIAGLPLTYKIGGQQERFGAGGPPAAGRHEAAGRRALPPGPADACLPGGRADRRRFPSPAGRRPVPGESVLPAGSLAAVVRVIRFGVPTAAQMHIPPEVMRLAQLKNGLALVTGSAGSGKSTTLGCIVNEINQTRVGHILTLEDPVEFIHRHGQCIITQREIPIDCPNYVTARRSALAGRARTYPLAGRDAGPGDGGGGDAGWPETGQLLLTSLHTSGAAECHRPHHRRLAGPAAAPRSGCSCLWRWRAVVSQQLVPDVDGQPLPVFEILYTNLAVRNLIRESKTHQLDSRHRGRGRPGDAGRWIWPCTTWSAPGASPGRRPWTTPSPPTPSAAAWARKRPRLHAPKGSPERGAVSEAD